MTNTPNRPDLDLNEIEQRAAAATKGPWKVELEQCDCSDGLCSHGTYVSAIYADGQRRTDFTDFSGADWQFIIRARTAVPVMAAEIRRLRTELTDAEVEKAKLIRWHGEDEAALAKMRGTIEGLRTEKRKLGELAAHRESELIARRAAGVVVPAASEETTR